MFYHTFGLTFGSLVYNLALAQAIGGGLRRKLKPADSSEDDEVCPKLETLGFIDLPFNPAFLNIHNVDGEPSLFITSFFNGPFGRDLVAYIPNISDEDISSDGISNSEIPMLDFDADIITDIDPTSDANTVWPNEAIRAPDGVFDFEAIIIPQVSEKKKQISVIPDLEERCC